MKKKYTLFFTGHNAFYISIAVFYAIPMMVYSLFCLKYFPAGLGWRLAFFGMVIGALFATALISFARFWKENIEKEYLEGFDDRIKEALSHEIPSSVTVLPSQQHGHKDAPSTSTPERATVISPYTPHFEADYLYMPKSKVHLFEESMEEHKNIVDQLSKDLDSKENKLREMYLEVDRLKEYSQQCDQEIHTIRVSHDEEKIASDETVKNKEGVIEKLRKTIDNQKKHLEEKEESVEGMEKKILDLNYEIQTLLHMADITSGGMDDEEVEEYPDDNTEPFVHSHPLMNVFEAEDDGYARKARCYHRDTLLPLKHS